MNDVWELVTANAVDKTDFWSSLNSQRVGGVSGEPIKELSFILTQQVLAGSVFVPTATGQISEYPLVGSVTIPTVTGSIVKPDFAGQIDVEEL